MSELLSLLEGSGALRPGHTAFRSGAHADGWVEKGNVFRESRLLNRVAAWQAQQIREAFPDATLLVGAPACGGTLASFIGLHLDLPVAYVLTDKPLHWHRMHIPSSPQRIVYIDDLICTGTGARAISRFLTDEGHTVLGVSAWLSRTRLEETLVVLEPHPYQTFAAGECPLCQKQEKLLWNEIRE